MLVERCLWRFHCSIVKGMGVLELFQLDGGTAPCTTAIDTFHVPLSFGGVGEGGGGGGGGVCVCVGGNIVRRMGTQQQIISFRQLVHS